MTATANNFIPTRRRRLVHGWTIAAVSGAIAFPAGLIVAYNDIAPVSTTTSTGSSTTTDGAPTGSLLDGTAGPTSSSQPLRVVPGVPDWSWTPSAPTAVPSGVR